MSKQIINAKTRTTTGKTAAKNLRKEGRIPAVVYNDKGEATSLEISEVEFNKVWRTITPTTSITLNIDGKESLALIKDAEYNIRTDRVLHADFFVPAADQKLVMKMKVHFKGTPAGVLKGGFKKERNNQVKIKATIADLPETIVADISKINVSEALRVKDLEFGKGVEVLTDMELPLVTVAPAR
ncbi:MAG: 50S ribosomal protein L25 [Treponema sp.]|jgi:large subunit ribosomal protein L25|nr:50S ribosomal protein L25 [Treponema bryantii]MBO5116690.1 50S ribosomal protein L25 [Treponema sp.]MBQ8776504.1 50S ribosomal protein L25 [Treponema sp.]MBR2107620.1 50S ribosomal protein L25 [Treponema sp.]